MSLTDNITQYDTELTKEEMTPIKTMLYYGCKGIISNKDSLYTNGLNIYYNFIDESQSELNTKQNLIIDDHIFSPIILQKKNKENGLSLSLSLTAKTSKPLEALSVLKFYYQPTLNNNGLMQINVYIYFEDPNKEEMTKCYYQNIYELHLSSDYIKEANTIQLFLTQGDPRTTRGTVTTVKNPTSGS